jgi:hypothetical protein
MNVSLQLKHSPLLINVASALRDFTARHGSAEIYYGSEVFDSFDGTTHRFPGLVQVSQLFPQQDRIALPLFDGFVHWKVAPVGSYSFEIVAKGATPSRRRHTIDAAALWPEWAADLRPYAEARKLERVEDMLKLLGFRNPVDAPASGSIAPEFRSKRRRCGIYVLHFANGEYYVGQTVDITRRFVQHRRRHADIIRVSFCPTARRSLDFHEAQLIRLLETQGFQLRNIDMTSILSTEPASFDEIMDAEQQQRWLGDVSYVDLDGERSEPIKRDHTYRARYQELKQLDCFEDVFPVVRDYIRNAIPAITRGEACYWQASVLPPTFTVLTRVNVNWQEVFFANIDDQGPFFYFILSKRQLQGGFGEDLAGITHSYSNLEWEEIEYRAGGSDQVCVVLWDAPTALRFVNDPHVIRAFRHYNLRLMKKGKCPWGRNHNFDLIDAILADDR